LPEFWKIIPMFSTNFISLVGSLEGSPPPPALPPIYAVGEFTTYKGVTENRIIKLNADGTKDTSFDNSTGFNGIVNRIAIDSAGKLYVGGLFTSYKGVEANRIIKLNADGTKDTSFDNSTGFNNTVSTLAIDSAGKLYVGGRFTSYKGVSENRIIKLNADGTKDTSFDNSTGFNNEVSTLAIDSAGKLYAGGQFTTYKGVTENRIIKLNADGTKDTAFDNSGGFNGGGVNIITIDSAGKLYVGGSIGLTAYKGVEANRIIKLHATGAKDTSFDNSTGFDSAVNNITIDSAGKLYVGGLFTSYKGVEANRIIKLNADGTKDTSFDNSTGFEQTVRSITINSAGKLYAGGQFTTYKGATENRIIELNADGTKNTSFDNSTGFNGTVISIAIDSAAPPAPLSISFSTSFYYTPTEVGDQPFSTDYYYNPNIE